MSGWSSIKFNNTFAFPDPQRLIINIIYGLSGVCGQCALGSVLFSSVQLSKLIKFYLISYLVVVILFHHEMANLPNFQQISLLLSSFFFRSL